MTDHAGLAVDKFKEGFNCAQSVVHGFAAELGGARDALFRTATAFGAGMGRRQEVCGAVSGALLVLGALFGRGAADDREKTETTYRLAAELQQRFTAAHGTVSCRELIAGYDLSTAEGQAAFKADNKIADCHAFVASVCGMLAALLAEQGSSRG